MDTEIGSTTPVRATLATVVAGALLGVPLTVGVGVS